MPQIVELIAGLLNVALNIKKQEITEKPGRDAVKAEQLDYYKDLQRRLKGSNESSKNQDRREEIYEKLK